MSEEKTSSGAPPPAMADAGGKSRPPVAHSEPESSCPPSDLISLSPSPRCTDAGAASEALASPDCRSFSQLLAGAMASPAASPRAVSTILSVPVVAVPCFLSPAAAVLDSPRFTFAMTHQAVLATVTAQAQMQIQAANSSSSTKLATSSQPVTTTINPVPLQQRVPHESKDNVFTPEVEQVHSSDQAPQSSQLVANTNSSDDGYNWRKYGQKQVKSSEDSRSYYKCTSVNCFAKKKVERCPDGRVTSVMYRGPHNHDPPQQTRCSRERGGRPGAPLGESESLNSPSCEINELDPSTSKTDQNYGNEIREQQLFCSSDCEGDTGIKTEDDLGDEPNPKRRYVESTMTFSAPVKMYKEAKIVVHSTSDAGHASDGYKWRKYGQKFVKGNSNPSVRQRMRDTWAVCRSFHLAAGRGMKTPPHIEIPALSMNSSPPPNEENQNSSMAATTHHLPHSPSFTPPRSHPFTPPRRHLTLRSKRRNWASGKAKKKNPWLDPFDDGADPDRDYRGLFADGKQDEDSRPPDNPDNPYGFLKFPSGYNIELAPLGSKLRGDVRRCCCVVSGGVYENLLFFPVVQMIKDRYPGVQVDIIAAPRGKKTYELNKNVRWADAYDPDKDFPIPAEYTDMIGILKNRYYDMILSTKLAGLGHAAFLFMASARERASYIYPNVNAAGAGLLLSETFTAPALNLSDCGYNMYDEMIEWLGRPAPDVPRLPVPPLKVGISKKLKEYVEAKYTKAGAEKGKYVVIHGIESDSIASMRSKGDTDSLLPIEIWADIAKEIRGVKPVFVIPHEKERDDLEEAVGEDSCILFITTPGKLAALIDDSVGLISTNTAAVQLANARGKSSIALFSSEAKGRLFVPNADEKRCMIISSDTGKLIDIDIETVKNALRMFEGSPVLAY